MHTSDLRSNHLNAIINQSLRQVPVVIWVPVSTAANRAGTEGQE